MEAINKNKWSQTWKTWNAYQVKSQISLCACGRRFVKTQGEDQAQCLFCLRPNRKRDTLT